MRYPVYIVTGATLTQDAALGFFGSDHEAKAFARTFPYGTTRVLCLSPEEASAVAAIANEGYWFRLPNEHDEGPAS